VKPAFSDRGVQIEMLRKLNEIPGLSLTDDALGGKPGFEIDLLFDPVALQKFKTAVNWKVNQIKKSAPTKETLNDGRA
jgi:hypothetical protein